MDASRMEMDASLLGNRMPVHFRDHARLAGPTSIHGLEVR
jgi:hypothetical protein